jgi:hypothetical protein
MDACWLPGGKVEVFVFTKGIKTKKPSNKSVRRFFYSLFERYGCFFLEFFAKSQIAGVSNAWNDVRVVV